MHVDAEMVDTTVERDMLIKKDILRTLPKKKEPNMTVAVTVQSDRFTDHFTARMCGEK
jgi:hypothetical protein